MLEKTYVLKVAFTPYILQEEDTTPESKYITNLAPTAQSANRWLKQQAAVCTHKAEW